MLVGTTGYTIHCWKGECRNKFINCLPSEDCFIFCTQSGSCTNSIINCPQNGNCNLKCLGHRSCQNAFVDATLTLGNLNILCDDNDIHRSSTSDHCAALKVYGSVLHHGGTSNIYCNGNNRSCSDLHLNCPNHADCGLSCNGAMSCQKSVVLGPNHADLRVDCNGNSACLSAIFNGQTSTLLNITGCTQPKSCVDLTMFCPPNTRGHKHCFVEGNDNLGTYIASTSTSSMAPTQNPTTSAPTQMPSIQPTSSHNYGITIYAVNGFDDIDVDYSGSFGALHSGQMFCGSEYNNSCRLASDNWRCAKNTYCNDVVHMYILSTTDIIDYIEHVDDYDVDFFPPENTKDVDLDYMIKYTVKNNPEIFIFVCVILMILTFMLVSYAKAKKDSYDHNAQNDRLKKQKSESVQVEEKSEDSRSRRAVNIPIYPISISG